MKEKTETRVSIKMNRTYFAEVAGLAQQAGIRSKGALLYNKDHGFDRPNTKSLAKFFRWLVNYYKETEPERIQKRADALARLKEAEKAAKELGIS